LRQMLIRSDAGAEVIVPISSIAYYVYT
jgi:hypothetical protein